MYRLRVPANPPNHLTWATSVLASFLGRPIRVVHSGNPAPANLLYGPVPDEANALRLPHAPAPYTRETIPIPPDDNTDPFAYIYFWLADQAHADAPETVFDEHDRLFPRQSFQYACGHLETPLVNQCLLAVRQKLTAIPPTQQTAPTPPPILPNGKQAIVVLSHDVDEPLDPGHLRPHLRQAARALRNRKPALAAELTRKTFRAAAKARLRHHDRHWLFREVTQAEANHGLRSTFFFATTSNADADAHYLDVRYRAADPKFKSAFRTIRDADSEVGLHISYLARESPKRIAAERAALEAAAELPVRGSRHHFWHMRRPFWPTLRHHADAGLQYDSSIAFNGAPGFRLAAALPFRPFDPETQTVIPSLQIPVMAMDGGFFYDPAAEVDAAVAHLARLLDTLKTNRGVAAIDWHARTSYPGSTAYRKWGQAYLELLKLLAADSDIAVLTAGEVNQRLTPWKQK